jgi:hypothetical protein
VLTKDYINDGEVGNKGDSYAQQLAEGVCALLRVPTVPKVPERKDPTSQVEVLEERFRKLKDS